MKHLFCLFFCLLLFSCKQQNPKMPPNAIPQEKMVQILADIHVAESRVENRVIYPDTALMTFNRAHSDILKQHGVTHDQFRETYDFYLQNLQQMDKLYEVIVDTLSTRETKARAIMEKNRPDVTVVPEPK